jgi:DivIVA domain-containing protein
VTNDHHRQDHSHHRTPESIRDATFQRRMRGLDADEVYGYLDLLADQVQATESELGQSRAENQRLHAELQRMRAELEEYEQADDRVNDQVIQLFSQAQLVAEEMVQDVSRDASERIGQARAHERKIVEEAMGVAGEQVRSYARSAQAQMQSIMDSFATEVERLGSAHLPDEPGSGSTRHDPLFDGVNAWPVRTRNGSRPESPGSH